MCEIDYDKEPSQLRHVLVLYIILELLSDLATMNVHNTRNVVGVLRALSIKGKEGGLSIGCVVYCDKGNIVLDTSRPIIKGCYRRK